MLQLAAFEKDGLAAGGVDLLRSCAGMMDGQLPAVPGGAQVTKAGIATQSSREIFISRSGRRMMAGMGKSTR